MYFDQHCYIVAYFQSAFSALVKSPSVYQPSQTPYEIIIQSNLPWATNQNSKNRVVAYGRWSFTRIKPQGAFSLEEADSSPVVFAWRARR